CSLRLRGRVVECLGLPRGQTVFAGAQVARLFLRQEGFGFAPTSSLLRSDLGRRRRPFYPPNLLHAHPAGFLDMLADTRFGFVHEVLSYSRVHPGSLTATLASRRQTLTKEWMIFLDEYGPRYFAGPELEKLRQRFLRRYYRLLVRGLVAMR